MSEDIGQLRRNLGATRNEGDITFHVTFLVDRDPVLAALLMRLYEVAQRAENSPTLDREDPLVQFGTAAFARWTKDCIA